MRNIQTVSGKIISEELGFTLMHEHCLVECKELVENLNKGNKRLKRESVTLENRGDVVYNIPDYVENYCINDIDVAIEEIKDYANAGGDSLVDVTPITIGRDPRKIKYISEKTEINIIMSCGFYSSIMMNEEQKKMNIDDIVKIMVDEFENGFEDTGIRPGIIGEVSLWSDDNDEIELKYLKAAGRAQKIIGCAISIHPPIWGNFGHIILDILEEEKVDMKKVVLCHCDPTLDHLDYHDSLVKRGIYIEYDQFGAEWMTFEGKFLPSDGERINAVYELIKRKNISNIIISQDNCSKIQLKKYGGWGYSHIIKHIIPRMKKIGINDEQIRIMTIENPKDILSF